MKIVYTEPEVLELLTKALSNVSPEGKVPHVSISSYSNDFCTVTFEKKEDVTITIPDEKPLDLSEIPF